MSGADALSGRVVVVTGASRGIGLATSRVLAAAGAKVALWARGAIEVEAAAAELGERGLAVPVDVADPASVEAGVERVREAFGGIDVLVNNAAVGRLSPIAEVSQVDLRDQIGINLEGPIHCIRAIVPEMRRRGGGDIVNLSSDSVLRPFPWLGIYAATKAALETLSTALRAELAGDGIRVSLIRSGPALLSFAAGWDPETAALAFEAWQAGGHLDPACVLPPERIAEAILFALTRPPEASVETLDLRPRRK